MKKSLIVLAVVGVLGVMTVPSIISTRNNLAQQDQNVELSYARVQIALSRQSETLNNMAVVAKKYASHEEDTFREVAAARSGLQDVALMKPSDIANNRELQKKLVDAQQNVSKAMIAMTSVQEKYPELQANSNYQIIMNELEQSQNRIAVERRRNQDEVFKFNHLVVAFPTNILAKMVGFGQKPFFQAEESQQHLDLSKSL